MVSTFALAKNRKNTNEKNSNGTFAITSKKWKEYTQTKDAEKKEKEDSMLKRKAMRETKKQEKEKDKSQFPRKRKTIQTNVLPEQNGTHITPSITKKKKTKSVETNASKIIGDNSKEVAENEKYVLQEIGKQVYLYLV
nr:uncharacterized protein LOC111511335 [Leptinotarsa decemlineata]